MNIDTTININSHVYGLLSKAIVLTGYSKNQIISSLMRRIGDDHDAMIATWTRIRYQKRGNKEDWRQLHLTLRPDEYEFFLDLRKVFKFSVSCLVAYAVEKYLDEILKKLYKGDDNYRYKNYMFQRIIVDGVVCWMLSWGIPQSIVVSHY
ncbi:MAG TPA: hypothetical protein PLM53_05345 [Spirochaetota bacterium]|nr:hypothetical protein [Spirochaetota bacterium]HPC40549.1 hypothetical protein [Spirochaetota bacterium]HPL17534.1 hypothetical protein [Spirochaetota bacterium]HQF07943.1 hypothetical protein [Spirochaetota bacterium]HQH96503.1 hypothetical protein [Spirochaetota bacterium]